MSLSFPTSPTVGQIYQTWQWNGSAWAPTGTAAPVSGQKVLLAQQTVTTPVASVVFTAAGMAGGGLSNRAFDEFQLDCINYGVDTNNIAPYLQVSTDGGTTWDASATYTNVFATITTSAINPGGGNFTWWQLYAGLYFAAGASNVAVTSTVRFWRPWDTTSVTTAQWKTGGTIYTPAAYILEGAGSRPLSGTSSTAFTALRLILSAAGNYSRGTFKLWGIQN